jgi:UDP-glucose 4-epimerase
MRVLITGGAGFIGSHLVDAMLDRGAEVAITDHLHRSPSPWLGAALQRGAQLHVADVRDLAAVRRAFEAARPEVILHLAAQVDVRRSIEDPAVDAQVNVAGTVSVLEAAREVGAQRVVMASTAAVYGDPDGLPTTEDAPIAPLSPYGTSKAAAEWYLGQYRRLHGISTLALRMANVYGPRQDPHGEAGVVAIFCGLAAAGRRGTIFGDGLQTRDYVYIDDVVEVAEALGLTCDQAPERPGEIARSCLDPTAAELALGWQAVVPLTEGLRSTLGAVPAVG